MHLYSANFWYESGRNFAAGSLVGGKSRLKAVSLEVKSEWIRHIFCTRLGSVTMTTESCKNGATTLSLMNFYGHVGHVTII